jgi:hypothetical protein
MQNLVNVQGEIKASMISNPAKLLAGYMAATGETNAKIIAAALGIPLRTVQRLKLEVATAHANSANDAINGASENANSAISGVSEAPKAPDMAFSASRVEEKLLPPKLEETPVSKNPLYPPNVIAMPGYATQDERCQWANGGIILTGDLQTFWLREFDGDERGLDLALKQAAGYVQPQNRCKPLEAQVSAQLARIVGDRRDRDRRYAAAATQKATSTQTAHGKPSRTLEAIARRSAAMEANA